MQKYLTCWYDAAESLHDISENEHNNYYYVEAYSQEHAIIQFLNHEFDYIEQDIKNNNYFFFSQFCTYVCAEVSAEDFKDFEHSEEIYKFACEIYDTHLTYLEEAGLVKKATSTSSSEEMYNVPPDAEELFQDKIQTKERNEKFFSLLSQEEIRKMWILLNQSNIISTELKTLN